MEIRVYIDNTWKTIQYTKYIIKDNKYYVYFDPDKVSVKEILSGEYMVGEVNYIPKIYARGVLVLEEDYGL